MTYNCLLLEKEDGIGIIYINRPETLNALDINLLKEMEQALTEIEQDKTLQVLIITGVGRAFVAGADISYMSRLSPLEAHQFALAGQRMCQHVEQLELPVIAAVNGFALGGGCELMLAADIRLAADTVKIGQPEAALGIMPGYGGTQRLPRLIGPGKAKEMLYTGKAISAQEAEAIGLVNHVYPLEDLMNEAKKLAQDIMKNAPIGVQMIKRAVNLGLETDLNTGCALELELFSLCFATEDQDIGMQAFLAKEKPVFKRK